MHVLSIRAKLVLAIVATLGVAGLVSATLVRDVYERSARTASEQALRSAAALYEDLERNDVEKLSSTLDALVSNPALREAYAARDRDRLYAGAAPIFRGLKQSHGITHWYFIDPEPSKRCFLRVHAPDLHDDVIGRATLERAIQARQTSSGKELGKTAFALRVVRPYYIGGLAAGYMELGEEIDHFLGRMKAQIGDDLAMFVSKRYLDQAEWARTRGADQNNWNALPEVVVVNSTTTEPIVDEAAVAGAATPGKVLDEVERGGSIFVRGVFPVRDAAGAVVGGLVVRHDITALHASMQSGRNRALGLMIALAVAASALVYLLLDRLIFRRLQRMMSTMEDLSIRLAGGDYDVGSAVHPTGKDEIGRFESFFGEFLGLIGNTLRELSGRSKTRAG